MKQKMKLMGTPGIEDAKFVGHSYKLRGKEKEVRDEITETD